MDKAAMGSVNIVSGLPRSGTSMMMRMLQAGGLPAVTDNIRTADHDNPFGYYEFEPVKRLKDNAEWLDGLGDRVVKIIYRLLYDLPGCHIYKVIFVRRRLEEVVASQLAMLQRMNRAGGDLGAGQLVEAYRCELRRLDGWINGQRNFMVLDVSFDDMLRDARPAIGEIAEFLGYDLDAEAMLQVIDRSLHRQRAADPREAG